MKVISYSMYVTIDFHLIIVNTFVVPPIIISYPLTAMSVEKGFTFFSPTIALEAIGSMLEERQWWFRLRKRQRDIRQFLFF